MTVYIFTFGGTASEGGVDYEISEYMDPNTSLTPAQRRVGGGFGANVAIRLLEENPKNWVWRPIDYKPGFRLQNFFNPNETYDIPQKNGSIGRALTMLGFELNRLPSGAKIVLAGLSQGGWICDLAFEEFRDDDGMFHQWYDDLVAVVTFGSPRRPHDHHIPLPGAILPPGQGVADFPHELSFGTVPGLVADPPDYMWSFCMLDDAAGDNARSGPIHDAQSIVANFLWDGDLTAGLPLLTQLGQLVVNGVNAIAWEQIRPKTRRAQALGPNNPYELSCWLPFIAGAQSGADGRIGNPHARYNSFAYDAIIDSPVIPGAQYVEKWNASLNLPFLSNATGIPGRVYRVSTGGTRNLGSGNLTVAAEDYIIHTGGVWQKANRNLTGGTSIWSSSGQLMTSPGGKSAVDLAVEFLIGIGNEYADQVAPVEQPRLGFTWWQNPPD